MQKTDRHRVQRRKSLNRALQPKPKPLNLNPNREPTP